MFILECYHQCLAKFRCSSLGFEDLNVSIDSVWFATKVPMVNQSNQLVIKLTNYSDEDRDGVRLSVNYDNQTRPLGLKNIKARSSTLDTVNLNITKAGWNMFNSTGTDNFVATYT